MTSNYDESKIKTLSSLEHIRLRTGMYVGRLGNGADPDDGIYILLKEIIDNSIDEFIMGHGKKIDIKIDNNFVSIRDYGRGIPLGKVIDCVSVINTGAKYNDEIFQFSVGLNGVGTKAVNALSSFFKVTSYREGQYFEAVFEKGKIKKKKTGKVKGQPNGTQVEFFADNEIFNDYNYNFELTEQRLWNYACLNKGLKLVFNKRVFESKNGLLDFLQKEVCDTSLYDIAYYKSNRMEFSFTHTSNYGETYFSFVNGQYTNDGGTHQSAFREGLLKGINDFFKKNYNAVDVRDGVTATIAIKLVSPLFESQTKNKLGNNDIRGWIVGEAREAVADFLHKNINSAKKIEDKIIHNENLRKELNSVKKEAKEAAKRIEIKIPNLKDCKYHFNNKMFGEKSTLFITEGQSAAGSIVSSRDVMTQAIFTIKGKPMNVYGKNKSVIYKNEELYNMMKAVGVEDTLENLRYKNIVIATDADVDGYHIRNLLLTFFLNFFEELIIAGHVYILETPLYRVRNKNEVTYCYNDKECEIAKRKIKNSEITRFKGLGEISPKEFGQFIGPDMRLIKINIKYMGMVSEILKFYMGKNTPERKDYIIENLI